METRSEKKEGICPREEIAAYIDGELSSREELVFEQHFSDCAICSEEIKTQRKILCALDFMLEQEAPEIQLPKNFTKVVTANAESNLTGLRHPKERSRALFICAVLFFLVTIGLGTEVGSVVLAVEKFTDQFIAVGGFVFNLIYGVSFGISVIFHSLCSKFIFNSILSLVLIVAVFVLTSLVLSRLVFRYNRS